MKITITRWNGTGGAEPVSSAASEKSPARPVASFVRFDVLSCVNHIS